MTMMQTKCVDKEFNLYFSSFRWLHHFTQYIIRSGCWLEKWKYLFIIQMLVQYDIWYTPYTAPSTNNHQIENVWVLVELKFDCLTFNCSDFCSTGLLQMWMIKCLKLGFSCPFSGHICVCLHLHKWIRSANNNGSTNEIDANVNLKWKYQRKLWWLCREWSLGCEKERMRTYNADMSIGYRGIWNNMKVNYNFGYFELQLNYVHPLQKYSSSVERFYYYYRFCVHVYV